MIDKIKEIVDSLIHDENLNEGGRHSWGCRNQRDRIKRVCELAINNLDGDILEIGCHVGLTTKILCEIAKEHNRKVVVIDPWNGQQEGNQNVYEQFLQNTKGYESFLEINRISSFSPEGKKIISQNKFAFCWIDGLHTYDACKQDIDSCVSQNAILAVDDLKWLPELMILFKEKEREYKLESYYNEKCREGYYISRGDK